MVIEYKDPRLYQKSEQFYNWRPQIDQAGNYSVQECNYSEFMYASAEGRSNTGIIKGIQLSRYTLQW